MGLEWRMTNDALLTTEIICRLQALIESYKDVIDLPKDGAWKAKTDAQIWLAMVCQVGVAGASAAGDNLRREMEPHAEAWYSTLLGMTPAQRHTEIHAILRRFGIRYANADARKCLKTAALAKNFTVLQLHGGPSRYLERLDRWPNERDRVAVVIREMGFMKLKGARDFLIGQGLLRDAMAFDVRVLGVLKAFGAMLPDDVTSNPVTYVRLETELLELVCRPAGVTARSLTGFSTRRKTRFWALWTSWPSVPWLSHHFLSGLSYQAACAPVDG